MVHSARFLSVVSAALAWLATTASAQAPAAVLPLVFEPLPEGPGYFARAAHGVTWRLDGARMLARTAGSTVELALRHADSAELEPLAATGGTSNYYFGRDPALWRSGVPHYAALRARDVRPGVDVVYRGTARELEFDLVLQPFADWRRLRLDVAGACDVRLLDDGSVALELADGELRLRPPLVYQERGEERVGVPCRYALDDGAIAFELGEYDDALALTIDPVVTFATLLGSSTGAETTTGVAVDTFGNMAVTGTTTATDFPLLNNLPTPSPLGMPMGFITKLSATGQLVFSTYFGGTSPGGTSPVDVGCDTDGQVVVGGNTNSATLPTTVGVVQPTLIDGGDWFFVCLLADGTLSWCTYYGGPGLQADMRALKVLDAQPGSVVAIGNAALPVLPGAYSSQGNIGVAGISGGNALFVSTMCGFSGTPSSIDVTLEGHICITGNMLGPGLPTIGTSFQANPPGAQDGFVFVFGGFANSVVFATYLGGSKDDIPLRIRATSELGTVDCTVAGSTESTNFPRRLPVQSTKVGAVSGFVTRFVQLGRHLAFSTYLGGSDAGETLTGLDIDPSGHTVVGGSSASTDLPFENTLKLQFGPGNRNVWLARFDPSGTALTFCTAWGGSGEDTLVDLAVGPTGEIVIAGHVNATTMPVTPNAQPVVPGTQDVFLAQLDPRSHTSYGAGTAGFWGFVPVLAGGGPDIFGSTVLFNVHDGRAQAPGLIAAGFGRTSIPFLGGQLLTLPSVTQPLVLGGSTSNALTERGGGYLHFGIPLPPDPGLQGLVVDFQAAFADASVPAGWTLTNGVELTIH